MFGISRRSLDETLWFIAAVDRAASPDAVSEAILSVVRPFGFSRVLAGIIPLPGMSMQQQVANVVLHRWPEQWSQRYFSQGYLFDDPTIQRVTTSTEPFLCSELEESCRHLPSAKRVMGEAKEFQLGFGFTVPMLTLDGQSAGFSIASDRGELPPHFRGKLQLLAMYSFGRALSLADTPPGQTDSARGRRAAVDRRGQERLGNQQDPARVRASRRQDGAADPDQVRCQQPDPGRRTGAPPPNHQVAVKVRETVLSSKKFRRQFLPRRFAEGGA